MATIKYELEINSTPENVYRISQDYTVRYEWDPFPEKIEFLYGATEVKKGAKVFIRSKHGFKMEVEFISVSMKSTAIKMVRGPIFLESFGGSWLFRKNATGGTSAKFVYSIKSKRWAFPNIADVVARKYFLWQVKNRLGGLKQYCESVSPLSSVA